MGEREGVAAYRDELLAGVPGRVVEVGAGSGLCFGHYPDAVTEVVAVEPEPHLRHLAEQATATAAVAVTVVDGDAERLPFDYGSFDIAVASLVLCSVPDQSKALTEIHRVLRPGGELRFSEPSAPKIPAKPDCRTESSGFGPRAVRSGAPRPGAHPPVRSGAGSCRAVGASGRSGCGVGPG